MKKKLFIGFASVAAVGTFWACGDGTINEWDEQDEITKASFIRADGDTTDLASMRKAAFSDCMANPDCEAKYHDYLLDPTAYSSAEDQPVSSATGPTSSMSFPMSSSSINRTTKQSSSSRNIIDPGSSSAETVPVSGLGSCKPTKSPIDKTKSTTWDFTPNLASGTTMQEFIQASYSWNFGDDGTGTGMTSEAITYAGSGPKTASVTVTVGLKSETIACSNLQVNGAPISCTCAAGVISPYDYTTGATVSWTATCSSTGATITSYAWSVATGDTETGSYTFTAPTSVAPKVTVNNDDGTEMTFDCPEVRGTEGPENEFDLATATDEEKALKQGVTYTITHPYSAAIQFNGSSADCTVEINGESVLISHYKAIQPAPASPIIVTPTNCTATIGGY